MPDKLSRSRVLRVLYTLLGLVFLGLGFIGVGVLGIPTFDFILLAAFFFAMGNKRLHAWIVTHRVFGPMITDYRAGRGFTRRMKVTGVAAVVLSFTLTIGLAVRNPYVAAGMVALAAWIVWYIVSRPTKGLTPADVTPAKA
ncbi:MAG: YbaN family protein [Acidimicrobiia bacterium]|nr:YbaN family protein [Acidimicrobiia bacterium]